MKHLHIQSGPQLLLYLLTISSITRPYTWPCIVFRFTSRDVPHIAHVLRQYTVHQLIRYFDLQFFISSYVFYTFSVRCFFTSFVSFFTCFLNTIHTTIYFPSIYFASSQVSSTTPSQYSTPQCTSLASPSLARPTLPLYLEWP